MRGLIFGTLVQTGEVHGDINIHGAGLRRFRLVLVIGLVLGILSLPVATQRPALAPPESSAPEMSVQENLVNECAGKLVDDEPSRSGAPIGYTGGLVYEIVVQNPSDAEILLTRLSADVTQRRPPSSSGRIEPAPRRCRFWTDQPVRNLVLNLDVERPRAVSADPVPTDGAFSMDLPKTEVPPKSFPYKVVRGEPEVLHVGFVSTHCDCEFTLVLHATIDGRTMETRLPTRHRIIPKQ